MRISRLPILIGYILILTLTAAIGYAYYNEESTLALMDEENRSANRLRRDINELNMRLAALSMLGETALEWSDEDKKMYRSQRFHIDSILCTFSRIFVSEAADIDSLRAMLDAKENKLCELADIYTKQKALGDEMANKLPVIVRQSTREEPQKARRKGFLGIFGKKEQPKPTATTSMLYSFNRELMAERKAQNERLKAHADSLARRNRYLNIRMQELISYLDGKAQDMLAERERDIAETREKSYRDIGILTVFVLLMLLASYGIIHRDLLQRERDRRKLEDSIRQNNALLEMRKRIILTISHDIRGPLNVISGSAELAIDTRDKKKRDGYLNNARILCRHVVHLLNNLLDVYRLNEAKETPNNIPFRLNSLLDRIALGAAQVINDKGLLFVHEFKDADVTVRGDEDRLEQIADNILSNAVKFTQSGTVGFSASYSDGILRMDFSDTGCGMSDETMERIFMPFERADDAMDVKGFGLGLSITKGLVSLLGGAIDVESDIGKGTVFHVCIPLQSADESEVSEDRGMQCSGSLRLPRNVIVIDDDPLQRGIVREMLERNSVSCTVCATAQDVVKAMRERDHDILLTDINMPGTSGFALLELLRKSNIGNSRTIPVVAMTARDDDENKPLIKSGFSGCIFKPFSMQELLERISMIMKQSGHSESGRVDFSRLTAGITDSMAILQSLADSTAKDMGNLRKAADDGNRKAIAAIIHRMKPVWDMLGLSSALCPLWNTVKDRNTTTLEMERSAADVLTAMENLMKDIKEEMNTYEEQDTDS